MSDLEAPIKEVTVYADCALVTHRGSIHLDAGEHELRINNLPQFFRDSLRAAGQGPQGMRILNVDITTAFYSRAPEADYKPSRTNWNSYSKNSVYCKQSKMPFKNAANGCTLLANNPAILLKVWHKDR